MIEPAPIVMPARVARRPRHGSIPILFTSLIKDGVPDFRVSDPDRVVEALANRLCAICGEPLDYWMVFIGSKNMIEGRTAPEPMHHEACIRYALAVCPYLLGERNRRTKGLPDGVITEFYKAPHISDVYLGFTRQYKIVAYDGILYCVAAPFKRVEKVVQP